MAPRKRAADKEPKLSLAVALEFIKPAQSDKAGDLVNKSHCRIAQGFAVAFDGVLTMGHPVEEEVNVCPQTFRLLDALKRCKKAVSITQLDDNLVIKSGSFRAVIPYLNPAALPYSAPDVRVGDISDKIREGFELLNPIVSGTGFSTVEASLLLQNNSMVATDRTIMVEYWHGINLPDGLAIPKQTIATVCKIKTKLVGVGVSDRSITFHYENGAWLKSQLYAEKWPNITNVIDKGNPQTCPPIPGPFFEALDAVAPFSTDAAVYTLDGCLSSHHQKGVGATYEMEGLPPGLSFSVKSLNHASKLITHLDLIGQDGVSFFFGENVRGAIARRD